MTETTPGDVEDGEVEGLTLISNLASISVALDAESDIDSGIDGIGCSAKGFFVTGSGSLLVTGFRFLDCEEASAALKRLQHVYCEKTKNIKGPKNSHKFRPKISQKTDLTYNSPSHMGSHENRLTCPLSTTKRCYSPPHPRSHVILIQHPVDYEVS